MNERKTTINWMMDETIAHTKPSNWSHVRQMEAELVQIIGNSNFNHRVIDPIPCLNEMSKKLMGQRFSSIIDLTGWLTPAMAELFPETPIENRFSLSRFRVVSSPKLETTGYKVSHEPDDITRMHQDMDLRRPLVIDDVSFSGWTSKKTVETLKLDSENTTHAFLIANTGPLGPDPSAVSLLESMGSRVVFGHELKVPFDDGWHLKDLHQHPNLPQSLVLSLLFQEAIKNRGPKSETVEDFFKHQTVLDILFPEKVKSDQVDELVKKGQFVLKDFKLLTPGNIHARNPFLWASIGFHDHIDIERIIEKKERVLELLQILKYLTSKPEDVKLAALGLKRAIENLKKVSAPVNIRKKEAKE